MKILFVIPNLDHTGAAKQLTLVALGLPRGHYEPSICVLGSSGPFTEQLQAAGVAVESLNWKRRFDLVPLLRLRQSIRRLQPDVIHAWGMPALRAVSLVGRHGARLVLSYPFSPQQRQARISPVDQWLLHRTDAIASSSQAESERCRCLGQDRTSLVSLGVSTHIDPPASILDPALSNARFILCAGRIEPHKGFRDAIWALDILKYLYDDVHLLVAGDGSQRARLQHFTRSIGATDRIHFLGPRADVPALLAASTVVWIPSLTDCGRNLALEAMMAARPVVASAQPGLAEVVVDGTTGFLFPPGDKVVLTRRTRMLLDDAQLRLRMGEAGRRHATERFAVASMVERFARIYSAAG